MGLTGRKEKGTGENDIVRSFIYFFLLDVNAMSLGTRPLMGPSSLSRIIDE
jgi:hypothetical protein